MPDFNEQITKVTNIKKPVIDINLMKQELLEDLDDAIRRIDTMTWDRLRKRAYNLDPEEKLRRETLSKTIKRSRK